MKEVIVIEEKTENGWEIKGATDGWKLGGFFTEEEIFGSLKRLYPEDDPFDLMGLVLICEEVQNVDAFNALFEGVYRMTKVEVQQRCGAGV